MLAPSTDPSLLCVHVQPAAAQPCQLHTNQNLKPGTNLLGQSCSSSVAKPNTPVPHSLSQNNMHICCLHASSTGQPTICCSLPACRTCAQSAYSWHLQTELTSANAAALKTLEQALLNTCNTSQLSCQQTVSHTSLCMRQKCRLSKHHSCSTCNACDLYHMLCSNIVKQHKSHQAAH